MSSTVSFLNFDGDEVVVAGKKVVCWKCQGEGKHTNPAIDGNGISAEEWENDWDEDSREGYLNGRYDICCEECGGLRVLTVVDEEKLNPVELEAYNEHLEDEYAARRDRESERRYGY